MSLFQRIEIELTSCCDMKCFACDRFMDVAPAKSMAVFQMGRFVAESLDLGWEWKRVHILGGEPTLHPQFQAMITPLLEYRKQVPTVELAIISNGLGHLAEHRAWLVANQIEIRVEAKRPGSDPKWFGNIRNTPKDEDPTTCPKPPCSIYGQGEGGCGLGFTPHGFFLCGAGAAIARVTGANIGVLQLSKLTHEAMLEQAHVLCEICGHWNATEGKLRQNRVTDTGNITGAFWTETLKDWQAKPMSLYGEDEC